VHIFLAGQILVELYIFGLLLFAQLDRKRGVFFDKSCSFLTPWCAIFTLICQSFPQDEWLSRTLFLTPRRAALRNQHSHCMRLQDKFDIESISAHVFSLKLIIGKLKDVVCLSTISFFK
jgi:hypothetical protein